jgi:hypothetical protein
VYKVTAPLLHDADDNGLADYYGSCFQPDLPTNSSADAFVPPAGFSGFYLVTAESLLGEGTFGFASNGLERPNTSPCP